MPNIVTKDLMKVYRAGRSEVIALRGLDMSVADGELVAVQGPSGCGKTTLLNLLGGIDRPTAGRIEVDGSNLDPACGGAIDPAQKIQRSEEHTSELQSLAYLVCRLLLEKKKKVQQ